MAERHVQMLVDVVVPEDAVWEGLTALIEVLNLELARQGLMETVWVARLPEDRL